MNKKTRLIILIFCVVSFLAAAPYIVIYSMGYRIDFENMKITATGGIYVKADPQADDVIIDSKIDKKPGIFNGAVFVQNLLPKQHNVLIKKDGYFDYQKNLLVQENEVSKLEHVLLIKNNIIFDGLSDNADYFSSSPNGSSILLKEVNAKKLSLQYFSLGSAASKKTLSLTQSNTKILEVIWANDSSAALIKSQNAIGVYYFLFDFTKDLQQTDALSYLDKKSQQVSFNPQNSNELFYIKNNLLYRADITQNTATAQLPILKNIISYLISSKSIIWLSTDGFLYKSDESGKLIEKLTSKKIATDSQTTYQILNILNKTFLNANSALLVLNEQTKTLENFNNSDANYKLLLSPDSQNLLYYNNQQVYIMPTDNPDNQKTLLYKASNNIGDIFWLNNYNVILSDKSKIIISEIDCTDIINAFTLPGEIILSNGKTANIKDLKMFFNRQDGKIYVLTDNLMLASEKITP